QATAILGGPFDAGAEVGSDHGEAVQTGRDAGSPPDAARPSTSAKAQLGLFSTEDCRYDQAPDPDPCPAGAPLTVRCDAVEPGRHLRSDAPPACGGWPLQPQGTRRPGGRRSTRWGEEPLVEAMEQRGRGRPEGMQQRPQVVAPPCGTRQRWWA